MKYFLRKIIVLIVIVVFIVAGCGTEDNIEPKGKSYFTYFDTVSYVYSYAGDSAEQFDERSADVSAILGEYHRLFDIYHEYSGLNNLCTLNKAAGGDPIELDEKLIDFLVYSKNLYDITDGEMNIMLGPVLSLWHNCREAAKEDHTKAAVPTQSELENAAEHTDISLLEIDVENKKARISDPKGSIDVGAVGKGYATEMAAKSLEEAGVQSYVLNIGGNIRIIGTKPDGSNWLTGIKDPVDPDNSFALRLKISDTSCVTSGVYERFYTVNGVRYHHIIDKDTLYPAKYFSSVSIITKDSALADALSTALFCMTYEEGCLLLEKLPDVGVIWIFNDGDIKYTDNVSKFIINT